MGLSPLAFSGISQFSQDFGKILERAQRIASFPLTQLSNQKSDLVTRKSLAGSLEALTTSFSASLEALAQVGDSNGISASSSNTAKVQIGSVTATSSAVYQISDISSLAAAANETSLTGYANSTAAPVSATGSVRLQVGSNTYNITLTSETNNLNGLRNAINALGAGVSATVFTTGTGATPNYLSISANQPGATTLALTDDPDGAATVLLTSANQGSNAVFKVNGVNVSKPSNLINDVVSGVTFTIAGTTAGSETVNVTLSKDRAKLSSSLRNVVNAYNGIVSFLDSQRGEQAGQLAGSGLLRQVQSALSRFTSFSASGAIQSLADLGIELDNQGKMSIDVSKFNTLSDAQLNAAFAFASSQPTGLGSLQGTFEALSNPVTGAVALEIEQYDRTEARLSEQIATLTERINFSQQTLQQRLQAADALLASLESQQQTVSAAIEGLNLTLFGRRQS